MTSTINLQKINSYEKHYINLIKVMQVENKKLDLDYNPNPISRVTKVTWTMPYTLRIFAQAKAIRTLKTK